jgi:hypothetical protein
VKQKAAVTGILAGKSGKRALLDAGYAPSTAAKPGEFLSREKVAREIERLAPDCTQDLIEGTTVRAMTGDDTGHAIAGATLAARLRGLLIDRSMNMNINASTPTDLAAMRAELARLYNDRGDLRPAAERSAQSVDSAGVSGDDPGAGGGGPHGDAG